MATQAIRFIGPPGQTITLDVFTLSSDTAEQSGLTCTEATNRKGLYTTQNFTDTLEGWYYIVKKISGTAIGSGFVSLLDVSATYDADELIDIDGYSVPHAMRLLLAATVGKVSGANTTTPSFRAADDSKTRISGTVDSSGSRTAVTLDAS
jgi:hypothetical protein